MLTILNTFSNKMLWDTYMYIILPIHNYTINIEAHLSFLRHIKVEYQIIEFLIGNIMSGDDNLFLHFVSKVFGYERL